MCTTFKHKDLYRTAMDRRPYSSCRKKRRGTSYVVLFPIYSTAKKEPVEAYRAEIFIPVFRAQYAKTSTHKKRQEETQIWPAAQDFKSKGKKVNVVGEAYQKKSILDEEKERVIQRQNYFSHREFNALFSIA